MENSNISLATSHLIIITCLLLIPSMFLQTIGFYSILKIEKYAMGYINKAHFLYSLRDTKADSTSWL